MKTTKSYVAYKPCEEPRLICRGPKGSHWVVNMYDHGIRYHEDEIGYYTLSGELKMEI